MTKNRVNSSPSILNPKYLKNRKIQVTTQQQAFYSPAYSRTSRKSFTTEKKFYAKKEFLKDQTFFHIFLN